MTSPATPSPKGEEETPIELARRVVDTWGDGNPPIVVLARALLSSSSREEVRREALEEAAKIAEERHKYWRMPHPDDAKPDEVSCDVTACAAIAKAIRALSQGE